MKTETTQPPAEVALYNLPLVTIAEWKTQYGELTISGPEDKTGFTTLRTARLFVRGKRLEISKRTDELIAPLKSQIADIAKVEKTLLDEIKPLENLLGDREDIYDAQVEELKQQKLREAQARISARINFLISHGCSFNGSAYYIEGVNILDAEIPRMSDEEFSAKQSLVSLAYEIEQKRIEDKAELRRIAEIERILLADKEKQRIATERAELQEQRDQIKAEQETAHKAQEAISLENKRKADELFNLQRQILEDQRVEREMIEQEQRRIDDINLQIERDKKSVADKKAAEIAAKKKLVDDKKQAEIDAELIKAARPDMLKLFQFSASLSDLQYPELSSKPANEIIAEVKILIGKIQKFINDRAEWVK